jgi:hypothetical protein
LGRLKARQDLPVGIAAGQSKHVAGLSQNKWNQEIAKVGIKAETRRHIKKDEYRTADQGKWQQNQHIEIEAEEDAGNADEEWQHFEMRSGTANAGVKN